MIRKLLIPLALVAALGAAACSKDVPAGFERGIDVTAAGHAMVKWDTDALSLNAIGSGKDRAAADASASQQLSTISAALRTSVPAAKISIGKSFLRYTPASDQVHVTVTATVRVTNTDDLEAVLRKVLELSPTTGCCGWTLKVEAAPKSAYLAAARKDALAAARMKALEIARAANVGVGKPVAIREIASHQPTYRPIGSRPLSEAGIASFLQALHQRPVTSSEELVTLDVRFEIA